MNFLDRLYIEHVKSGESPNQAIHRIITDGDADGGGPGRWGRVINDKSYVLNNNNKWVPIDDDD